MSIFQEHNLNAPLPNRRPFGIRVSLQAGDPFANLVGSDWHRFHWFATTRERDSALADMASRIAAARATGASPGAGSTRSTASITPGPARTAGGRAGGCRRSSAPRGTTC